MEPVKAINARIKILREEITNLEKAKAILQPPEYKDHAPDELKENVEKLFLNKHRKRGYETKDIAAALDVSYQDAYSAITSLWKSKKLYQTNTPAKSHKRYAHVDKREAKITIKAEIPDSVKKNQAEAKREVKKTPVKQNKRTNSAKTGGPGGPSELFQRVQNELRSFANVRKYITTTDAVYATKANREMVVRVLQSLVDSEVLERDGVGERPTGPDGRAIGRAPIRYRSLIYQTNTIPDLHSQNLDPNRETKVRPGEGLFEGRLKD
jgi:hypothetical protein